MTVFWGAYGFVCLVLLGILYGVWEGVLALRNAHGPKQETMVQLLASIDERLTQMEADTRETSKDIRVLRRAADPSRP